MSTNINDYAVGDQVSFGQGWHSKYPEGFVGTVEKVGRKNLTIRYTKGAGSHLFTHQVDPTTGTVRLAGGMGEVERTVNVVGFGAVPYRVPNGTVVRIGVDLVGTVVDQSGPVVMIATPDQIGSVRREQMHRTSTGWVAR